MAKVGCLICGHVGLDPHLEILLRCPDCGFVTANLDGPLATGSLYGGDYFTGREYLDYRADDFWKSVRFTGSFWIKPESILRWSVTR